MEFEDSSFFSETVEVASPLRRSVVHTKAAKGN